MNKLLNIVLTNPKKICSLFVFMDFILNKIVQKVSESKFNRTQYKVKRLKTISGVIHVVIAEINDENSEILVALSVLEDKNKFKVL